jgi:hypothetical protein
MPSRSNPVDPPIVRPAYERLERPDAIPVASPPPPPPPPPPPDVTVWVDRLNARLSPPWQENEIRGGRSFHMPGISKPELEELTAIFSRAWDVGMCREGDVLVLICRPRRTTNIRR